MKGITTMNNYKNLELHSLHLLLGNKEYFAMQTDFGI